MVDGDDSHLSPHRILRKDSMSRATGSSKTLKAQGQNQESKVRVDESSRGSRLGPGMGIGARRRDRAEARGPLHLLTVKVRVRVHRSDARGPLHLLRARATVRIRVGVRVRGRVWNKLGVRVWVGVTVTVRIGCAPASGATRAPSASPRTPGFQTGRLARGLAARCSARRRPSAEVPRAAARWRPSPRPGPCRLPQSREEGARWARGCRRCRGCRGWHEARGRTEGLGVQGEACRVRRAGCTSEPAVERSRRGWRTAQPVALPTMATLTMAHRPSQARWPHRTGRA